MDMPAALMTARAGVMVTPVMNMPAALMTARAGVMVTPVMDMPAALMTARAGGMVTPVMDGRARVIGASDDGRRPCPDGACNGENAQNNETYDNQQASHEMDFSFERTSGVRRPCR